MCGIAGLISPTLRTVSAARIGGMLRALEHRGPDDRGFAVYDGIGVTRHRHPTGTYTTKVLLVHRRLTILDCTTAAWQPFSDPTGRFHLVFNGEIYNYVELRDELTHLGHHFQSTGDTEVLLAALIEWDVGAMVRLVGMFAFALLDTERRSVLLARDPFGIKPLYYARCSDGFAFASEIQVLLSQPGISRTVNAQRLYDYLRFNYTDHGSETMLEAVRQVAPAHYMTIALGDDAGESEPVCYWRFPAKPDRHIGFDEAVNEVRAAFLNNIGLHLRSDVPVGAMLSGGIDSSSVVMAIADRAPSISLKTFSYVAANRDYSEERWIDIVAAAARAEPHKVQLTSDEMTRDLPALIHAQGEPFGDAGVYAEFRLYQRARESGIKVMLSGHGADELLGGYRRYYGARLASLLRSGSLNGAYRFWRTVDGHSGGGPSCLAGAADLLLPHAVRRLGRRLVGRELVPEWINWEWFRQRGVQDASTRTPYDGGVLAGELRHSLIHGLPHHLRYEDRNAMAHSIENRVPFLTPELVSLLLSLPEDYAIGSDGTTKAVFRAAMRGIVPPEILDRRDKIGFRVPQDEWLAMSPTYVEGLLSGEECRQIRPFRRDVMTRCWQKANSSPASMNSSMVWRWLSTIEWTKHIDAVYD